MNGMIVAQPGGGALPIDAETIEVEARKRWGSAVEIRHAPSGLHSMLTLDVEAPGETFFHVDIMRDLESINLDGTPEQNYATAAWLRSLMPADAPRVIVFDGAWSMHAELTYGCTAEGLRAGAVDHSVPGWDAGDPDLY